MQLATHLDTLVPGLLSTPPEPLPFAPSLHIRSFVLRREAGDVLVYGAPATAALEGVSRAYVGHWHEASFGPDLPGVPLFAHEADRDETERHRHVRASFRHRHVLDGDLEVIPIPGHTPGSTAYLWDSGEHRYLFTADTLYLRDGEWVTAVLPSSDPAAYRESLALIRELDFDVLVPWAASVGDPPHAVTSAANTRRRIDALLRRLD